jgi:hypothetical protein
MNLAQLEVKRLSELRGAIREARHMVHASRVHLARAIKLHIAAAKKVNRTLARYRAMDEERAPEEVSDEHSDVTQWLTTAVDTYGELERTVEQLIARKRKSKAFSRLAFSKPDTMAGRRKLKAAKAQTKSGRRKALTERIEEEKRRLGPLVLAAQQWVLGFTDDQRLRNTVTSAVGFARDMAPNLMASHIATVGNQSAEGRDKLKAVQAQSKRIVELLREHEAIT